MSIRLYVGYQTTNVQGEKQVLGGYRCFTAAYATNYPQTPEAIALLDSGAFSDPPHKRKTPQQALKRQLIWEETALRILKLTLEDRYIDWFVEGIASYDLLIDETWTGSEKIKRRWSLHDAEEAVITTVNAAKYLATQRYKLQPRILIMGCQGVDAYQYKHCVEQILEYCEAEDWIGLGGWCILGRMRSYIPIYWETLHQIMPLIAKSPVRHIHLYGSLLDESCAALLWFCDKYNLSCSVDSGRPIADVIRSDHKRSGARCSYWRDNVAWWQNHMLNMRQSKFYREPPRLYEQLSLFA